MTKVFFALAAVVVAGCSSVTCEDPSLYEPIEHCEDCNWKSD
jgi:hypothetical protein